MITLRYSIVCLLAAAICMTAGAQEPQPGLKYDGLDRVARVRDGIFLYGNWDAPQVTLDTCLDMSVVQAEIPVSIRSNGRDYPVLEIGHNAFNGCRNLTVLKINAKLDNILKGAFLNCPNLRVVQLSNTVPPTLGQHTYYHGNWDEVFEHYHALTVVLVVPPGCEEVYRQAPGWGEFKNIQSTMPDNVELKVDAIAARINEVESRLVRARKEVELLEKELDALKNSITE